MSNQKSAPKRGKKPVNPPTNINQIRLTNPIIASSSSHGASTLQQHITPTTNLHPKSQTLTTKISSTKSVSHQNLKKSNKKILKPKHKMPRSKTLTTSTPKRHKFHKHHHKINRNNSVTVSQESGIYSQESTDFLSITGNLQDSSHKMSKSGTLAASSTASSETLTLNSQFNTNFPHRKILKAKRKYKKGSKSSSSKNSSQSTLFGNNSQMVSSESSQNTPHSNNSLNNSSQVSGLARSDYHPPDSTCKMQANKIPLLGDPSHPSHTLHLQPYVNLANNPTSNLGANSTRVNATSSNGVTNAINSSINYWPEYSTEFPTIRSEYDHLNFSANQTVATTCNYLPPPQPPNFPLDNNLTSSSSKRKYQQTFQPADSIQSTSSGVYYPSYW